MAQHQVRRATPGDAAGITRAHVRGWQVGYRGLLPDAVLDGLSLAQRTVDWRDRLTQPDPDGATTLVAVTGTDVVGFASVGATRDGDAPAGTGELWALYVDPDRWRHGAGRALEEAACLELVRTGAVRATLWVLSANARARAFYESCGWGADGTTRVDRREAPAPVTLAETRYARRLDQSRRAEPSS